MRRRKRVICWLLCLLAAASVLIGCDGRGTDTELDISDWQSWRIGTPLAWSSDYYLSEQVRIPHLYLYDSIGDCIMALRFGYVDAIAVDALYAYSMVAEYSDLVIQDEPIGEDSLVAYITNARRDILEQMNAYIPKLKASETYADMVERANAEEFVPNTDIPQAEDGEVLRVAINTGGSGYPYTTTLSQRSPRAWTSSSSSTLPRNTATPSNGSTAAGTPVPWPSPMGR